jgi:hypothetical protein
MSEVPLALVDRDEEANAVNFRQGEVDLRKEEIIVRKYKSDRSSEALLSISQHVSIVNNRSSRQDAKSYENNGPIIMRAVTLFFIKFCFVVEIYKHFDV